MKYSQRYGLQPADRIVEPLFQTGVTKHHSIYLGEDFSGQEWIAENHKIKGVQIITAKGFFSPTKQIARIEKFNGSNQARKEAVQRALQLAGKPYNLLNYNCEHYANEVLTGRPESKQVTNAFVGLFVLIVLGAIAAD